MKFKALCMLAVTLGSGIGTSHAAPTPGQPVPAAGLDRIEKPWGTKKEKDIDTDGAIVKWRQIGFLKTGARACPPAAGWETSSLLDLALREVAKDCTETCEERGAELTHESLTEQAKRNLADLKQLHKLGLDRVCVYTATNPEKPDPSSLPAKIKPKPDRLALSTTSAGGNATKDALSEAIWPALAAHYREQTLNTANQSEVPIPLPAEPTVRLTFIDSQPEDDEFPFVQPDLGESMHGYTLAYLARNVVCPVPGNCAARVATRRALSFNDFTPNAVMPDNRSSGSGHVGLVSDLATAIVAEVLYWRQVDPHKKLILNLSLGWDGELFGDLKQQKLSKLDPSVQAVYNAIRFARRSGALVIAAAGNRRGGSNKSTSPLLPAAWELNRPGWLPFFLGRRPVFAVGGVDWQGIPLSNARHGGFPRRVAYGDHAVAETEVSDEPTAIYTGTSVSAASASSIAAVIWHLRPDLSPRQVMRLITRSGNELPSQADFYAWKKIPLLSRIVKAPHTRGLSLCRAVKQACSQDGGRCLAQASLPECPEWQPSAPKIEELVASLPGSTSTATPGVPFEEVPDVTSQRWVYPQPDAVPCPSCTLLPVESGGGQIQAEPVDGESQPGSDGGQNQPESDVEPIGDHTLTLVISTDWMHNDVHVTLDAGAKLYIDGVFEKDLPNPDPQGGPFMPGKTYRFTNISNGTSLAGRKAEIRFTANNRTVFITNPIL